MSCAKSLSLLVVVVLLSLVQSKEPCNFENYLCMTRSARYILRTLVAGIKDLVEPIDPLLIGDIKGEVPGGNEYSLTNPKMTGLKNCNVTEMLYQPDRVTFQYELFCPQLVLQYGYKTKGTFGPLKLDANGHTKVTLDDYVIILKGHSECFISEQDHKLRTRVIDFNLETQPKGNITFEASNLVSGDREKSEQALAWINEHSIDVEKDLRPAVIQKFVKVLIDKSNIIMSTVPLEELYFKV